MGLGSDEVIFIVFLHLQERLEREEECEVKEAKLLRGNPLLNNPASFIFKKVNIEIYNFQLISELNNVVECSPNPFCFRYKYLSIGSDGMTMWC